MPLIERDPCRAGVDAVIRQKNRHGPSFAIVKSDPNGRGGCSACFRDLRQIVLCRDAQPGAKP